LYSATLTFNGKTTRCYGNFYWNNYMILWVTFIGITTRLYKAIFTGIAIR